MIADVKQFLAMQNHEQTLPSPTPPHSNQHDTQDEKLSSAAKVPMSNHHELNKSPSTDGKQKLRRLLNRNMKITMTDGRTLIGMFLCTDKNCNVILGSCQEYLNYELVEAQQKRQQQLQQKSVSCAVSEHLDGSLLSRTLL